MPKKLFTTMRPTHNSLLIFTSQTLHNACFEDCEVQLSAVFIYFFGGDTGLVTSQSWTRSGLQIQLRQTSGMFWKGIC